MQTAFVVCGRPGAGKTIYAQKLAEQRTAALLDIDLEVKDICELLAESL